MTSTAIEKRGPELPDAVKRRGVNEAQWRTLKSSLYPGASSDAVLMVIDYCRARQLDPMKRPCHIVPVEVKVGERYEWREIVMPGIYELRTTAQRTDLYLGHSTPDYGPTITVGTVAAPEWCAITFYRLHPGTGQRIEFPVRTLFREVVAKDRAGKVNARWSRAPVQMLTKCCEAAGLREAFPDEIGGEQTSEELDGQRITVDEPAAVATVEPAEPALAKPTGFDDWLDDLTAVADEGAEIFASAWGAASIEQREYLNATEPERYELLKAHAATKGSPA
jgi:phage recombination protein Bet